MPLIGQTTTANGIPFDNSATTLTSTTVQNAIIEVNNNAAAVTPHATTHLPNGTDPLTTAIAVTLTPDLANAMGTNNSFARSNHVHNVPTAAPNALIADGGNIQGIAATFARSDHLHDMPTDVPLSTGSANAKGTSQSFARADHIHNTVVANQSVNATSTINSTSNTPVTVTGMTLTVAVTGTYLVLSNLVWVAAGNNITTVGLYLAGVLITNTAGSYARNANNPMTHSGFVVTTLTAGQVIDMRWNTTGAIQNTANLRSLAIIRLG